MLNISKELFSSWNENKITYCHWKSNEHLNQGLEGETDLDVLASRSDKKLVNKILVDIGFLACKSPKGSIYPNVEDWLGFDKVTGKLIHLHLHYRMITGHKGLKEYDLPWTEEALSSRIHDKKNQVYVVDPNLEIVILYTRIGLKASPKQRANAKRGKWVMPSDIEKEITFLKGTIQWVKVEKILYPYYKEDTTNILQLMKQDKISCKDYLKLIKVTSLRFKKCRRGSAFNVYLRKWYYVIVFPYYKRIHNYFFKKPYISRKSPVTGGFTLAFLGQDGAGKSTITHNLLKWLTWKLDARQFYLGSGEHFNPWEKRLQRYLHEKNNILSKVIRAWLPFRILSKQAKGVYRSVSIANRYADKGGIAIFDRYPQMQYQGINDGPKIRASIMKRAKGTILKSISERYARYEEEAIKKSVEYHPDVVLKLMLSPEESIRRKPQENYELVKQKHEIIKNLQFEHSEVYTIDATQPYEQELIEIKNIIWDNIIKGVRNKYHEQ